MEDEGYIESREKMIACLKKQLAAVRDKVGIVGPGWLLDILPEGKELAKEAAIYVKKKRLENVLSEMFPVVEKLLSKHLGEDVEGHIRKTRHALYTVDQESLNV